MRRSLRVAFPCCRLQPSATATTHPLVPHHAPKIPYQLACCRRVQTAPSQRCTSTLSTSLVVGQLPTHLFDQQVQLWVDVQQSLGNHLPGRQRKHRDGQQVGLEGSARHALHLLSPGLRFPCLSEVCPPSTNTPLPPPAPWAAPLWSPVPAAACSCWWRPPCRRQRWPRAPHLRAPGKEGESEKTRGCEYR